MANGGGVGVFRVPTWAAVHPSRPPCVELRPHPLRETQVGKFLKTIACTETQLWAGQESGVRVWKFSDAFEPGNVPVNGRKVHRGDEEAAPFYESISTSPTLCMMVDNGSKLVWSGHKDGKIRSWKMDQQDANGFKEGSEGGIIRVWPWESIEKSLALSPEERRMAALLVERSVIDLRTQVTVNGQCNLSSSDVKYLLADNVKAKMWACGSQSFSLWYTA
ncbi:hypothetical protein ACS0TY_026163 [Phlomoides rotata]